MERGGKRTVYFCLSASVPSLIIGCFSPVAKELGAERQAVVERQTVKAPYDIVWDSAIKVLDRREFVIFDSNPDEGTVSGEVRDVAIDELDCGSALDGGSKRPKPVSATTTFNLQVRPQGNYASTLEFSEVTEAWVETPFEGVIRIWCSPRLEVQHLIVDEIGRMASATQRPAFVRRGD